MTTRDEQQLLEDIGEGELSLIPVLADGYEDRGEAERAAFVRWAATKRPDLFNLSGAVDWWGDRGVPTSWNWSLPQHLFARLEGFSGRGESYKVYPSEGAAMLALLGTWRAEP